MAKAAYHTAPSRKAVEDEKTKIAKLRDLRLADDAARREAGTWGEMSVGEIAHEPAAFGCPRFIVTQFETLVMSIRGLG